LKEGVDNVDDVGSVSVILEQVVKNDVEELFGVEIIFKLDGSLDGGLFVDDFAYDVCGAAQDFFISLVDFSLENFSNLSEFLDSEVLEVQRKWPRLTTKVWVLERFKFSRVKSLARVSARFLNLR
jgi:hypothetical protein